MVYSAVIIFALGILFTSVFRSAAVRFETNHIKTPSALAEEDINIEYSLAYPGSILPDSVLWPVKAIRDRMWIALTPDKLKKIELKILFADKRLGSSILLFERGKNENAVSTLTKAEKYLEEASLYEESLRKEKGIFSQDVSSRLAYASLKHYEVLSELELKVPDDIRPTIVLYKNIPIKTFERARNSLLEKGSRVPNNPFDWQ